MDDQSSIVAILFIGLGVVVLFIWWGLHADKVSDKQAIKRDASSEHPELKSGLLKEISVGRYADQFEAEIFLKADETLCLVIPDVSYCEERVVSRRGQSGGASFRVARGLWIRTGSFGSEAVEEITQLDVGDLILTSTRLIFVGARKLIEYPLSKILRMSASTDQLAIARSGKQKIEYFVGVDSLSMWATAKSSSDDEIPEEIRLKITGEDIKTITQWALKQDTP